MQEFKQVVTYILDTINAVLDLTKIVPNKDHSISRACLSNTRSVSFVTKWSSVSNKSMIQ